MEFLIRFFVLATLASLVASCSKTGPECFSSPGKTIVQDRELPPFHLLSVHDNVDVVLVRSNTNKVKVYSGEKTINGITTDVDEKGHLHIRNSMQCRFLKQKERINRVTVFYARLDTIEYRSVGSLSTSDAWGESTWVNPDSLVLDIFEGAGDSISLRIETPLARIQYRYGTSLVRIEGSANVAFFYHSAYGLLDAWDLGTGFNYIETRSPNNLYVNANLALEATINGEGNIFYHGNVSDNLVREKLKGFGNGRIERRNKKP